MIDQLHFFVTLSLLLGGQHAQAQQFANFGTAMSVGWEGISPACGSALNSTISCPIILHEASLTNYRLDQYDLDELCTSACRNTLATARNKVIARCKEPNDVEKREAGLTYPATFVLDHYLLTYDLACRKDPATNKFCDVLGAEWLSTADQDSSYDCHHCVLGALQLHLNSPLEYSEDSETDFRSLTASCSKTQYPITRPSEYAVGTWESETPVPTPTCLNPVSVGAQDTCETVSQRHNVSTDNFLSQNSIPWTACADLGPYGSLCLPDECVVHKLDEMDTCENITARYDITDVQFLAWNSNINALCSNLKPYIGSYLCVGPPGGKPPAITPTVSMPETSPTAPATVPANAHPDSNRNCGRWYEIQKGDTCEALSVEFGIALRAFYFLNPHIDAQCLNLWLETSYCVQPVGDMASYPGFSTSNFITLTSTAFETTTSTSAPLLAMTLTATSQLPVASGSVQGCYRYRNYVPIPAVVDQSISNKVRPVDKLQNDCEFVSTAYNVDVDDLLAWNPSLSSSNCQLKEGFSYCVLKTKDSGKWIPAWHQQCGSRQGMINSGVIVDGIDSKCDCFTAIEGSDISLDMKSTCADLVESLELPVSNIAKYNNWIGPNCDESLYSGLGADENRAVCIGILGLPTQPVTTPVTPTMSASSRVSSSTLPPSSTPSPISTDGTCGPGSSNNATCAGSGFGSCCSTSGWCGDTKGHCGAGNCHSGACQEPDPGFISTDGKCGPNSSMNATCGGSGFGECCSNYGWCGDSNIHCGPGNCYSGACETGPLPSPDGTCGPTSVGDYTCEGTEFGRCCSEYGWCGDSESHCKGSN